MNKKILAYGSGLVLVALVCAGIYRVALYQFVAGQDQYGLLLASFVRETVPGLRVPMYFPLHGSPPTPRHPKDMAFVTAGVGSSGGCDYRTFDTCQAFSVSSEILLQHDKFLSLLRFLEQPCASFEGVSASDKSRFKTMSPTEIVRLDQQQMHRVFAWRFFGCDGESHEPRTIVLNVVDILDDPKRLAEATIQFRIIKEYK